MTSHLALIVTLWTYTVTMTETKPALDETVLMVRNLTLGQCRDNPEKVLQVVRDLQSALEGTRKCHGDPNFWPGREWVPAENSYPGDSIRDIGCLGCQPRAISVIEYNCATTMVKVKELDELRSKNPRLTV